jgi:hypothetical protein
MTADAARSAENGVAANAISAGFATIPSATSQSPMPSAIAAAAAFSPFSPAMPRTTKTAPQRRGVVVESRPPCSSTALAPLNRQTADGLLLASICLHV